MENSQVRVEKTKVEETSETITHFFEINTNHPDWPLSLLVAEAVQEVAEKSTFEIEPLANSIDPDALDDLFKDRVGGHHRSRGEVMFPMEEYMITVVGNDRITVTESV